MVKELQFNICKLDNSQLAKKDVKNLQLQIDKNISDPLQYSSLYWPNHLCSSPNNSNHDPQGFISKFDFVWRIMNSLEHSREL